MSRNIDRKSDNPDATSHGAIETKANNNDENDNDEEQRIPPKATSGALSSSNPTAANITSPLTSGTHTEGFAASKPGSVDKTSATEPKTSSSGDGDADVEDIPPAKRFKTDGVGDDSSTSHARPPGLTSTAPVQGLSGNSAANEPSTSVAADVVMDASGNRTTALSSTKPETPVILAEYPLLSGTNVNSGRASAGNVNATPTTMATTPPETSNAPGRDSSASPSGAYATEDGKIQGNPGKFSYCGLLWFGASSPNHAFWYL